MSLTKNSFYVIGLLVLAFSLTTGCTPAQPAQEVEASPEGIISTAESTTTPLPTATPVPTTTPEPTITPLPTATAVPSPTVVPAPDLNREFDMTTCSGDKAIAAFYEDMTVDALTVVAKDDFYGPDIAFDLWSHFAQQAGGVPVDTDGNPFPYHVFANLDNGDSVIYDVCLKRRGAAEAPEGVSVLAPVLIPSNYVIAHCENDYNIPDFIPFDGPDTIEVSEQTTVSQFLEEHALSPCYGFHKDGDLESFFYADGNAWVDNYQKSSQRQLVVAHFWDQGAEPLPPPFDENGVMRKVRNQFPYDAIIPPGEYAFYEEREMLSMGGYTTVCSDSPPVFIAPVSSPDCYHGFQQGPNGFYHQANDFRIAIGEQGYAPSVGTVIYTDSYFGGRVIIDHGGCWYSQLGHSTPLVGVGDQVT